VKGNVVLKESAINGTGVFAATVLKKGQPILKIDDSRVVTAESPLREADGEFECHCDYLAAGKVVLLQAPERHINHSCDPNTFVKTIHGVRYVFALYDIPMGAEITYDYCINGFGDVMWECNCGSERGSALATFVFRNVLGFPVWTLGFVLAARVPALPWFNSAAITALGWLIITAGATIILVALATIRWKALGPTTHDTLVNQGIYRHVRDPIHAGTLLEFIGIGLILPTPAVGLACVIGIFWIIAQTWLEEIDLLRRLPNYRDYMNAVPRFLPRFRKK